MKPILKEPNKPRRTPLVNWAEVAQLARDNPGKFVLAGLQLPHSTVTAMAQGKLKHIPRDEFEYQTENNQFLPQTNGRRCDLYVKYTGKAK